MSFDFNKLKEEVGSLWPFLHEGTEESEKELEKEWNKIKEKYNISKSMELERLQLALGLITENIIIDNKIYCFTGVLLDV